MWERRECARFARQNNFRSRKRLTRPELLQEFHENWKEKAERERKRMKKRLVVDGVVG